MLQTAAMAAIGCVLALLLRQKMPELSLTVILISGVLILGQALRLGGKVVERLWKIASDGGVADLYITPVLKCVGIGLLTELASQLCRDAGQGSTAAAVQLCGSICAMFVSLPLLEAFLDTLGGFL